ncbi:TVP38/TMEM64 family protein [Roseomonas rosulenta]|uniref:TVP38/TMEM64 family protein n=1 Tax=Roseomonas rosulenta TaxID=2748667 RepID=UPI0018DFA017|nr:VTT domain-containing protein [Roseomonas rosulenta]
MSRVLHDRRVWFALAVVALMVGLRASGAADALSLDTLARHRAVLVGLVADNVVLAALAYAGLYVAAVAFSLPGAVFLTLAGGFLFGAVGGTLLTAFSATLGATLVFLFARRIFGADALDRLGPTAARLADGIRRNAASYLLVLRLVPLFPFFLVNLVPAFVGVRLGTYLWTTLLGILPGTAVFSLAGAGLGSVLDAGGTVDLRTVLTPEIIAALFGLAALSLAAIPLKARLARAPT